ncbi:T9SS type A sorting domain-containing protein [Hymenobacter busanensis]|uniref:T9SS type A sorting domain-containing protein n=1 Tax=Hymenobacter busanensis TaxID=2607656 RepID=A0A7L5A3U7_9BACT|nr:T9SS type A sorting domain-containing protein [Hymenobacter busanensis]KAA9331485.1 T9SS type A sorting domain-containing protein [Hymenobacter busanensis]QHJ08640.1 T9SS type A sorting domain-containing protein [Hymenobacter busanensis]
MKAILFFALPLLAASAVQAQPALPRLPKPTSQSAERSVNANPAFRLTSVTKQQYRNSAWLDTLRFTYLRFNAANLPMREVRENAPTRGAAFRLLRQENYQYNAAGKKTSDSTFVYNNGTLNTAPSLVVTFTYNSQGLLAQELQQVSVAGTLRPYGRDTYTYNAQGQNTRILGESYFGSSWLADYQELFTYNAQGKVSSDEFQVADASGSTFSPFLKDIFTYNAQGLVATDLQQQFVNGAYADAFRVTNTYNATTNLLTSYVLERAVGIITPPNWQPYARGFETYDADLNLTQELTQQYRNGAYADDERYLYTYQRILATAPGRALQADLAVYPNPTAEAPIATYRLPAAQVVTVELLDALGRVVAMPIARQAQAAGGQRVALPGALPAGLYTVRVRTAEGRSQQTKLVVQ